MAVKNNKSLVVISCVSVLIISYFILTLINRIEYALHRLKNIGYAYFYCYKYSDSRYAFSQMSQHKLSTFYSQNFEYIQCMRMSKMQHYTYPYDLDGVDKRRSLSSQEYLDVYDGKWPVIVTDVVPTWPASQWTHQYFSQNYGNEIISVQSVQGQTSESVSLSLLSYLNVINESSSPATWMYLQDELFLLRNPELRSQVLSSIYTEDNMFSLFPPEVQPWDCMLLWGSSHSRSSLHIDPYNWTGTNAVIYGRKKWKLIPPGQDAHLSVIEGQKCGFPLDCYKYNSDIDAFNLTESQTASMKNVRILEVEQGPGDMLFIPSGWFHQAYNTVPTLAVSGELMNHNNYLEVLEEVLKAGHVDRRELGEEEDLGGLSPQHLVKFILSKLSTDVLERGASVTKAAMAQIDSGQIKDG